MTPFRIHDHKIAEDGSVTVLIPKFKNKFFISMIPRNRSNFIKISLDELGSAVWLEIDGEKKVGQIVKWIDWKVRRENSTCRGTYYKILTNLYQNKFISFNEINTKSNE